MKTLADYDKEIGSVEAQPYLLRESLKERGLYASLQNFSQTDLASSGWDAALLLQGDQLGPWSGKFHMLCGGARRKKEKNKNRKLLLVSLASETDGQGVFQKVIL